MQAGSYLHDWITYRALIGSDCSHFQREIIVKGVPMKTQTTQGACLGVALFGIKKLSTSSVIISGDYEINQFQTRDDKVYTSSIQCQSRENSV